MRHEPTDRTLLRSLVGVAAVFAVIFTLNGIGFTLRSAHLGARERAGFASGFEAFEKAGAKVRPEAWLIAHGLKPDEVVIEATPTAGQQGRGHGVMARGLITTPTAPQGDSGGSAQTPGEPPILPVEPPSGTGDDASPKTPPALLGGSGPVLPQASEPATAPVIVPGNPPLCEGGFKVESPSLGTHTYEHVVDGHAITITIVVYDTASGQAFDWTSSWPVERVVVKGGSLGTNQYSYDPPATSDGGLHAPQANDNNPHWAGLSYIAFCFGEQPPREVTKTFELTYPGLPEGAHAWVSYRIGDSPSVRVGLLPAGGGVYTYVLPHIPAGSVLRGEWLVTYGEITENLGEFCEVLVEDKTNALTHAPQVSGTKYEDLNGNGARDEGEPGISDWTIRLLRKAWLVCEVGTWETFTTVKTGSDGAYSFVGLPPGQYKVEEEMPEGWKQTDAPESCEFTLGSDTTISGLDFGNVELPDVTVLKFEDVNGNGERDALPGGGLEPVLSGWKFVLAQGGEAIAERTTGEDGLAVFADLDLGQYSLNEVAQGGWKAITSLPCTVALDASGEDVSVSVGNQRIPAVGHVDLMITKASNPTTVAPGGMVTYRLTYQNLGDEPATDFKIVDDYDQRLVSEVVQAGGGVVDTDGGTITWTFAGPLSKADGPRSVVYTVRVGADVAGGTFVDNVAVIEDPEDVDLSNNTDDASVEVVEPYIPFTPDDKEPYLPYTGGEFGLIALAAGLSAFGGVAFRMLGRERRGS